MLDKQRALMEERGKDRDNDSPIYMRRSPGENYGVASSKMLRIRSLLSNLDRKRPQESILKKLIEECLDVCNYLLFIACLCSMVLEDQQEERTVALYLQGKGETLKPGLNLTVGIGPEYLQGKLAGLETKVDEA